MGSFAHALGTLPTRYNANDSTTVIPRRAVCTGANAVNGFCSH
jgi:hypothetical protein